MAVDPVEKLTRLLADHDRRLRAMERSGQLSNSSIRVDGQDITLADSVRAAISADLAAAQAVTDASTALARADGVVNTYFTDGATPPSETPGLGDFWYRRDTKFSYQWDGDSWEPVKSPDTAAALAAAAAAQSAADGKISTWYSASTPPNPGVGDIWYKPPSNEPRRWDGSSWVLVRDGKIQDALDLAADAQGKATTALNSANGKTKVVYSTSSPSANGVNAGDTWFQTDSGGVVLGQWSWSGSSWTQVTPQSATIASLDAGRITTGTLAAGVSITAGSGGNYVRMYDGGLVGYVNYSQRFSVSGSTATMIADLFRSANYVNGGTSYVSIGDVGDYDGIDGIRLVRPAGSQVTLKNVSDYSGGVFQVNLRNNSNANQGGYNFGQSGITALYPLFSLSSQSGGSNISMGNGYSLSLNGGGSQVTIYGQSVASYGYSQSFYLTGNGGGMVVQPPPNGAYGTTLLRSAYYGGGNIKLTSDGAVQIRNYNDDGYGYLRAIMQDQSSPDLKENIVPLNVDAVGLLGTMDLYAWDWRRGEPDPAAHPPLMAAQNPPPKESGVGLLLSEMPYLVQPDSTATGYNTGSMIGLLVRAVQQLTARLNTLETS